MVDKDVPSTRRCRAMTTDEERSPEPVAAGPGEDVESALDIVLRR
jgi:hypothetical protein